MTLKQMLVEMLNRKASDLHIRVGIRPHLRVNGLLEQINTDPITIEQMDKTVSQILNEKQQERFHRKHEIDLALSVAKLGRFRINLFRQRGTSGIAIRAVQDYGFEVLAYTGCLQLNKENFFLNMTEPQRERWAEDFNTLADHLTDLENSLNEQIAIFNSRS